jgi:hypothetical protein
VQIDQLPAEFGRIDGQPCVPGAGLKGGCIPHYEVLKSVFDSQNHDCISARTRFNYRAIYSGFFIDGNAEGFQEALILRSKTNPAIRGDFLGLVQGRFFFVGIITIFAFVEPDSGFQNKKNVIARTFDFANGLSDSLGIGQGLVDRVAKVLHQAFETFFQVQPPLNSIASRFV